MRTSHSKTGSREKSVRLQRKKMQEILVPEQATHALINALKRAEQTQKGNKTGQWTHQPQGQRLGLN